MFTRSNLINHAYPKKISLRSFTLSNSARSCHLMNFSCSCKIYLSRAFPFLSLLPHITQRVSVVYIIWIKKRKKQTLIWLLLGASAQFEFRLPSWLPIVPLSSTMASLHHVLASLESCCDCCACQIDCALGGSTCVNYVSTILAQH